MILMFLHRTRYPIAGAAANGTCLLFVCIELDDSIMFRGAKEVAQCGGCEVLDG